MGLGPKSPGAERHPPQALSRDVLLLVGLSADLDRGPPARGGVRQVSPGNVASSACTLASAGPSACWAESGRLRLLSSRRCPHTRRGTARGCDRPRLFSRLLFISTRPRVVIHRCVIYSCAQIVPALAAGTLLFGSRVPSNVPVILYMSVFGFCTERSSGLISCMSCPGSRISRVSGWGAPVGGGVGSGAGCARCCRGVGACRPSRPAWRGDECECERA